MSHQEISQFGQLAFGTSAIQCVDGQGDFHGALPFPPVREWVQIASL
jgi:hypothetical protein